MHTHTLTQVYHYEVYEVFITTGTMCQWANNVFSMFTFSESWILGCTNNDTSVFMYTDKEINGLFYITK